MRTVASKSNIVIQQSATCCGCGQIFIVPNDVVHEFGRPQPWQHQYCRVACIKMAETRERLSANYIPDIPQTDMQFARLHEATHIAVARHLGSRVLSALVCSDLEGYTFAAHARGPAGIWIAATVAASAVVFDTAFRRDPAHSRSDREQVADLQRRFREQTGAEMPCPFESANRILHEDEVYRDLFVIARALVPDKVLSGVQIDALFA
jgi:hypothetical protein